MREEKYLELLDGNNDTKGDVVFYLNDKELTRYDLINEFYGERESTIELLAYENNVNYDDIKVKIEIERVADE